MPQRRKTGFDRYFDKRMAEPRFAAPYKIARADIDAIDRLIRALDQARVVENVSKAELARHIGAKPEIVRRLFTTDQPNPTIETVLKIATALGYELRLVQTTAPRTSRRWRVRERPRASVG